MRRLPRLAHGSASWELPLADCTARALEEALLSTTERGCRRRLAALFAGDPALFLWAICQAQVLDGQQLRSCSAAAQWLAVRLVTQFDWPSGGESGRAEVARPMAEHYARLAAAGVVTGRLARRLAEAEPGVCPEEAHAAGLLHAAPKWLNQAAIADVPTDQRTACLPRWLADCLAGVAATGHSGTGPWVCADRAAAMLAGLSDTDAPSGDPHDPLHDLPELERVTAERWRECDEAVHQRLPALTAKLKRLTHLEQQFHAQLEADKLEAMKELAFGAGHEINNPLANISARAQTLLKEEHDPERRRKLAAINRQAFRAHEMIADLMLFARPPELRPQPIDLVSLIDQVVGELAAEAVARGTALEHRRPSAAVLAWVDEVQLAVALRALCINALEALGGGGRVRLEARMVASGGAARVAQVVVADTGPGIRAEIRRHLFDPFFSGREAGRGLGFGLSKCWRIVTDHGGQIVVDSPAEGGAIFTISLPAAPPDAPLPHDAGK